MTQGGILTTFKNTWREGVKRQNQILSVAKWKDVRQRVQAEVLKKIIWTDFFNIRMIEHWDSGLQRGSEVNILGKTSEQPVLADPGLPRGWTMWSAQAPCSLSHLWHSYSMTLFSDYCRASVSNIQLQTAFSKWFFDVANIFTHKDFRI